MEGPAVVPTPAPAPSERLAGRHWLLVALLMLPVLAGQALRLTAAGPLWLDEAQSVAIARLPLAQLFDALRQDGSPPLYYVLLHAWIEMFGTSATSVRALSAVAVAGAIVLAPVAARMWSAGAPSRGRAIAAVALVLAAVNPWLTRYATEARMYALVVLLVLLFLLILYRMRREPGLSSLVTLATLGGLLLLTHYWAFFLLGSLAIAQLAVLTQRQHRRQALRILIALAGSIMIFLPWLPSMLFQIRHTGTPWANGHRLSDLLGIVFDWSSGGPSWARPLALPMLALALSAVVKDGCRSPATKLAAWTTGTLILAFTVSAATDSAVVSRYTAVVVPLVLILVSAGISASPSRARIVVTSALAVLWLAASAVVVTTPRSQAAHIARAINVQSGRGDVVVFCPDQLGPAVHRLITAPAQQITYPSFAPADRVNWIDYRQRYADASPVEFARRTLALVPPGAQLWLVTSDRYGVSAPCIAMMRQLSRWLGAARVVVAQGRFFERATAILWVVPSR